MGDLAKIDPKELGIEYKDGDYFNEDENNEKIVKKMKSGKDSMFNKLLRRILPWNDDTDFNPELLSDEEYKKQAEENVDNCMLLFQTTGWKEIKKGMVDGDVVEYLNCDKFGKVYCLTATIDCPAEILFDEFRNKVDEMPKWNPTLIESKYIRRFDQEFDITYQVTSGGGGGAVKPRDFINVRMATRRGDRYLSSGVSIEYPGYPPSKKFTRGVNKVGCWSVQPIPPKNAGDSMKCQFQWLMCTDLKGWIPQYVLDVALPTAMIEFVEHVRAFVEKKRAENVF